MFRFVFVLVFIAGALLGKSGAALGDGWKNLQVLPKNIPKDQLKAVMKASAKALGVDCDFCHEMPDPEKDTKKKLVAREMMRMENEINSKFLKGMDKKVSCATCHRGKEKPEVTAK